MCIRRHPVGMLADVHNKKYADAAFGAAFLLADAYGNRKNIAEKLYLCYNPIKYSGIFQGGRTYMNVINFFESDRQEHWLEEIARSDWGAGEFLHSLIKEGNFFDAVGEGSKVFLLTDGDELISYCTYAQKDDIQPTELSPWMGFVYTFPERRGHRYVGMLFDEITRIAKEEGVRQVYISTNHIGLYEKYGFTYMESRIDIYGEESRIYCRQLVE